MTLFSSEEFAEITDDLRRRMFETRLLCANEIREISRYWDMYSGRHEDELRRRLQKLGVDAPSQGLVDRLLCSLRSWNARHDKSEDITPHLETMVFEAYQGRMSPELRCEICGYHFIAKDVSKRRLALAEEAGLRLADFRDPRRESDLLKPLSSKGKDRYYTKLELDHIVPQAALGWADIENIAILCRFCNIGKSGYTYPYENLSECVVRSLSVQYNRISGSRVIPSAVARLRATGGVCERSGKTTRATELTVRIRKGQTWYVPWNLEVVAYDELKEDWR